MTVAAPTDPPSPVYSARPTFVAGNGDRVDIDGVSIDTCDLEVVLSGYPASVERGGMLSFRASAINGCNDPRVFDGARMYITGPASVEQTLYDGAPVTVIESVGSDVNLPVPLIAPLGTYSVEVTIYRDGSAIDADEFEVNVIGD